MTIFINNQRQHFQFKETSTVIFNIYYYFCGIPINILHAKPGIQNSNISICKGNFEKYFNPIYVLHRIFGIKRI